jgi:hypothetical protein
MTTTSPTTIPSMDVAADLVDAALVKLAEAVEVAEAAIVAAYHDEDRASRLVDALGDLMPSTGLVDRIVRELRDDLAA